MVADAYGDNTDVAQSLQTPENWRHQRDANHWLAEATEAYGLAIGQPVRMHRSDRKLSAVDARPDHLGEIVEEMGCPLRGLPIFDDHRPHESRAKADAFAAFAQHHGLAVYHFGFRVGDGKPVPVAEWVAQYRALSAERPKIELEAWHLGLEVHWINIEQPPKNGGAQVGGHGHGTLSGPRDARRKFGRWLRETYCSGWISVEDRSPAKLAGYLAKGPASVPYNAPVADQWMPEHAHTWVRIYDTLPNDGRLHWCQRYGRFADYWTKHKGQHARQNKVTGLWAWHDAAPARQRNPDVPADGERVVRAGTLRTAEGVVPVLFVEDYENDFARTRRKYRDGLAGILAWAAAYVSKSTAAKARRLLSTYPALPTC